MIQVDLDEQDQEFGPISANCSSENAISSYVNKDDQLLVKVTVDEKESIGEIEVLDLNRKLIHCVQCEINQSSCIVEINAAHEYGIYVVRYVDASANNELQTKAFIQR